MLLLRTSKVRPEKSTREKQIVKQLMRVVGKIKLSRPPHTCSSHRFNTINVVRHREFLITIGRKSNNVNVSQSRAGWQLFGYRWPFNRKFQVSPLWKTRKLQWQRIQISFDCRRPTKCARLRPFQGRNFVDRYPEVVATLDLRLMALNPIRGRMHRETVDRT